MKNTKNKAEIEQLLIKEFVREARTNECINLHGRFDDDARIQVNNLNWAKKMTRKIMKIIS